MATIAYLMLDQDYDPTFANGTSLTNAAAVSQAVLTRLKLFMGEWWEDLSLGLPVFQQMLGQLGSKRGVAAMQLAIQQNIVGAPYVTAVTNVQVALSNAGRLSFTAIVQTAFGPVTVNGAPGASASLG